MNSSCNNGVESQVDRRTGRRAGSIRAALTGLLIAFLATASVAQEAAKPAEAPKGDSARELVGKPIQAARELIQAKKYRDALAKVHEAEAVPNLGAYEKFVIDLTRGSAAQGAGDNETAMSSFESVVASGKLPAVDQVKVIGAIVELQYQAKD